MAGERLGGIVAAALTPVAAGDEIDTAKLAAHSRHLLEQGCRYVSLFGSTGEGPSFSTRQRLRALETLARSGVPMDRLIPAAMSSAVDDTATLLAASAELGCRAALIVPPYYYAAADQAGLVGFFSACADRLGGQFPIDVVLYHIPAMSRVGFSPALVRAMLDRFGSRVVGIKDSTGRREHTLMLAATFPELSVFTGDDRVLPALRLAGGGGLIGGMANIVAPELRAIYDAPKGPESELLIRHASARIAAVEAHGGIPALRALLAEASGDDSWATPMPPLSRLPAADYTTLRRAFEAAGFRWERGCG